MKHRRLPTYQISLKSKNLFVGGRTYGGADGHFRPTLLRRLGGVDLKMCKVAGNDGCSASWVLPHAPYFGEAP